MSSVAKQATISILVCFCAVPLIWIGVYLILFERNSYQGDPFSAVNDICAFFGWVKVVVGAVGILWAGWAFWRALRGHSRLAGETDHSAATGDADSWL